MLKTIKTYLSDFIGLIYPEVCAACEAGLISNEKVICLHCRYNLPKTDFYKEPDNPVFKIFNGRANINAAASYYYFYKKSKVQRLVHQLKYKGRKDVGIEIGRLYGIELRESEYFKDVDIIVPVPLHPKKQKKRGYNQSEIFAMGLQQGYKKIMLHPEILQRDTNTETQTKKGRFKRWENVEKTFKVPDRFLWPDEPKNRVLIGSHILLVDDVITTGSTLDACANALLKIPGVKISIATIACAQ